MSDPDGHSTQSQNRTLIIGIGNEYRCDDGVGIAIVKQIAAKALPGVEVMIQSGEGAALMECWKGFERVVIVDAVQSKSRPGTIHRLNPAEQNIPSEFFHYSTHAFSLAESIELARALDSLPKHLIVFGVEGENFAAGMNLSKVAADAVTKVVEMVMSELEQVKDGKGATETDHGTQSHTKLHSSKKV